MAYLRDAQVLGPCDSRQVNLCGEEFPDAQLRKGSLQAVGSGDGELGQGELIDFPENGKRNVRVTELYVSNFQNLSKHTVAGQLCTPPSHWGEELFPLVPPSHHLLFLWP